MASSAAADIEQEAINHSIIAECERLRTSIQTINDRVHGPLDRSGIRSTLFPFVLLLGNHSSGKSSFVNYLLQRKVQVAGVAPTDDLFTIIAPGAEDKDRDGTSLVGDPDLGFAGLKHFGPVLVHRTQLKIRAGTAAKKFCVVDTPGMIDSPLVKDHFGVSPNRESLATDRGYDFEGVCRWYAERADVILLFFDPDKPGTTGETLSIFTNALAGMDHKLLLILNKADQFRKIHDFARAYGSLCWNLSKVIPRKDLPQIHTMCLPLKPTGVGNQSVSDMSATASRSTGPAAVAGTDSNAIAAVGDKPPSEEQVRSIFTKTSESAIAMFESAFLRQGYADLEASRIEVTKEVFNSPKRRVDHEITRLSDSVSLLLMHCRVVDHTVMRYRSYVWSCRLNIFAASCIAIGLTAAVSDIFSLTDGSAAATGAAVAAGGVAASATAEGAGAVVKASTPSLLARSFREGIAANAKATLATACIGISGVIGLHWWQDMSLVKFAKQLVSAAGFAETFERLYARQIAEKDEFSGSLWRRIKERLRLSFTEVELKSMRGVSGTDFAALERIADVEVGNLRRQASPNFPKQKPAANGGATVTATTSTADDRRPAPAAAAAGGDASHISEIHLRSKVEKPHADVSQISTTNDTTATQSVDHKPTATHVPTHSPSPVMVDYPIVDVKDIPGGTGGARMQWVVPPQHVPEPESSPTRPEAKEGAAADPGGQQGTTNVSSANRTTPVAVPEGSPKGNKDKKGNAKKVNADGDEGKSSSSPVRTATTAHSRADKVDDKVVESATV